MKFYDRKEEIKLLERSLEHSRNESRMTVLMGRRRIGKTELSLRCGDETILYFFVAKKTEALLCQDFVAEIKEKTDTPILGNVTSFAEIFKFVLQLSAIRPLTLVIDEFQNFLKVNPSVFGDIQRDWDLNRNSSHLNLIISGSVFTLMKKIFEDYQEPLFDRANELIKLHPFSTQVLKEILSDFNPHYSNEDLLTLFSITGGIPWYVSLLLDNGNTSKAAMLKYLTNDNSPFINEGRNILIEEFGSDYITYFSILTCIASGMRTRAEIEGELNSTNIGSYLTRLERYYNLVTKTLPINSKPSSKKVRYQLNDCFLILWFRFFYKFQSLVENRAMRSLATIIERDFDSAAGFMLERYFTRKFEEEGKYIVGKWWDRKGHNEIDLIIIDPLDNEVWFYEVKVNPQKYNLQLLQEKVKFMLEANPAFKKMKSHLGCLSIEDM
jgi:AAA+ ATPase superfamily predicted ATPase